jgi:Ca-activated chloride channel family protein
MNLAFWRDVGHFRFIWPWALLLLALVPVWWAVYADYHRRRLQRTALQFSYAAVAAQIARMPGGWRRWKRLAFPTGVSLLLIALTLGLARPTVTARVPVQSADVMLVLDISLSMMADDIRPSRLDAARRAAADFVRGLPETMRVGLEVFAGDSYVLTPPTRRHDEVIADLNALRPEDLRPRTEIGSALHTALHVLNRARTGNRTPSPPVNPPGANSNAPSTSSPDTGTQAPSPMSPADKPPLERAIVLLSDGDSHEGYPWDRAAEDARREGTIIHSIGIGSVEGDTITYQGLELPVLFDERTLRRIAAITGGQYFRIFRETDFRPAYEQIKARTIHYEEQDQDLGFVTAAFGLLVLIASLLLLI